MTPALLHVVRPFGSEEEYLAAEAWTIDARGMLLVGEHELATDTAVVFDVALSSGAKVIRAEGRVTGYVAPSEERAGGVRVRFRKFGAQTKAFIDRAVQAREEQLSKALVSEPPPPSAEAARAKITPPPITTASHEEAPAVAMTSIPAREAAPPNERSGIHRRLGGPVAAPPNRNELLARLRERLVKSSATASSEPLDEPASKSS
jgi:hypothetical protein